MDAAGGWLRDHERLTFPDNPAPAFNAPPTLTAGAALSVRRYQDGEGIDAIAASLKLKRSTICKHLADAIAAGRLNANPRDFYSAADERAISEAVESHGLDALSPLKAALGEHISYETLHFYRAFAQRGG